MPRNGLRRNYGFGGLRQFSKVYLAHVAAAWKNMSNEQDSGTKPRRDVKEGLKSVRVGVEKLSRDVASTTEKWAKETEKWAKETSPKVAATIDETVEKTATALKKTMSTINTETKPQQVKLLKSYQRFLSKQVEIIERRIKELTA